MQYRKVGQSGVQVSSVSLGGWITFGGSLDDGTTREIVQTAIDGGVNFIDLADVYGYGGAEKAIGAMLSDFTRSELVISSKVFGRMSDAPNDAGLSRKHIMESAERSLRNLRTDYLDLYYCHRFDPQTPLEETVAAMDDLVHQGKILYWGTSVWSAQQLRDVTRLAADERRYRPTVEQPPYSLLDRGIEAEVMPTASKLGMGLTVFSPLAGGMLTGKYNDGVPAGSRADTTKWLENKMNDANLARVREFCGVAEELGCASGQLALAWILSHDEISSVITGATRAEHVQQNLGALEVELSEEVRTRLETMFPA
jgi:voltage-dependent potassium channel beta subunit